MCFSLCIYKYGIKQVFLFINYSHTQDWKIITRSTLSYLLPTGTIFVFLLLSPIFNSRGQCTSSLTHILTISLLSVSAIACSLLCLTDVLMQRKLKGCGRLLHRWSSHVLMQRNISWRWWTLLHAFMSALVFAVAACFLSDCYQVNWPSGS